MVFELTHDNLATALREYLDRRNIAVGKQCAFTVKTSRKGLRTSRVIVKTVDEVQVALAPLQPVVEAPMQSEEDKQLPLELPMKEEEEEVVHPVRTPKELFKEPEVAMECEGVRTSPFKKLLQ